MSAGYPLHWPTGWRRTPDLERDPGRFRVGKFMDLRDVTVHEATARVLEELRLMKIRTADVIISTNIKTRKDGFPLSGQKAPADPGVAVYFEQRGRSSVIPCDRFQTVEQNLAAVAATINALRALERYGSGIMERAFTGFEALPNLADEAWWIVLQVPENAPPVDVERAYMTLRSRTHPDKPGGDATQFDRVQKAWIEYGKFWNPR